MAINAFELQNKKFLYVLIGAQTSSFVRGSVYKEEFKKRNIQVDYFQLNSQKLTLLIYSTSFYPVRLLFRILNKLYFLLRRYLLFKRVAKYDVIVAIKYIDSKLLKQIKFKSNALLIYDFDDAVWLKMFFGEDELLKKLSIVDYVTSDNSYLAKFVSSYNKNSYVVNGPCQIEKFISKINNTEFKSSNLNETVILGWVGSNSTLFYLYKIYDALELIGEKYANVVLKLVGTGYDPLLIPPFEKMKVILIPEYDQNEMIKQVYSFDIGLYPLFLNQLSLGRGSLKATIYMAGSIPTVCSSIGENEKIIQDGVNGFLADNTDEWVEKLSLLIENPTIRKEIGKKGFDFAASNYSIESCLTQFLNILK